MSSWEFAHSTLGHHFKGVIHPQFFGNEVSPLDFIARGRGKPKPYLMSAVDLVKRLKGKTIVEVGCMRQLLTHPLEEDRHICCGDGHSTIYWGKSGLDVHSVDINEDACKIAAKGCAAMPNVRVTCVDGIEFLQKFQGTIDLLYLDAWDALKGTPYAEKHLEAYEVCKGKLAPSSIVLIDDTDIMFGGKGRMAIPAIIRDGYELLVMGRQTMLMRLAAST